MMVIKIENYRKSKSTQVIMSTQTYPVYDVKTYSHRARLRPRPSTRAYARRLTSTDVDGRRRASTPIWNTRRKACAFTQSASTTVDGRIDALKIEPCSILSAFTSVDGRRRTRVYVRLRPSTPCWSSNGKRRCGTWHFREYSIHKIMQDEILVEAVRRRNIVYDVASINYRCLRRLKNQLRIAILICQTFPYRETYNYHYSGCKKSRPAVAYLSVITSRSPGSMHFLYSGCSSSECWVPQVPVVDRIQWVTYESTFWSENCPLVVRSQGDDVRQVAVASESCHESTLPAAVVKFFDECENMRKLEARQHRCHYQTPFSSVAWSNDYSCQVEGLANSSASTSVDARVRASTDVHALGVNGS